MIKSISFTGYPCDFSHEFEKFTKLTNNKTMTMNLLYDEVFSRLLLESPSVPNIYPTVEFLNEGCKFTVNCDFDGESQITSHTLSPKKYSFISKGFNTKFLNKTNCIYVTEKGELKGINSQIVTSKSVTRDFEFVVNHFTDRPDPKKFTDISMSVHMWMYRQPEYLGLFKDLLESSGLNIELLNKKFGRYCIYHVGESPMFKYNNKEFLALRLPRTCYEVIYLAYIYVSFREMITDQARMSGRDNFGEIIYMVDGVTSVFTENLLKRISNEERTQVIIG